MTTETAVQTVPSAEDRDHKRSLALLKAVGLDRVAPEQRELALAIAKRYDLDLMLKHLVLIEGRPYLTRDGLLHIAHRSGQLDGIETTDPTLVDGFWRAECSVFRKDMSRPFRYAGRYPEAGQNKKFAPEMAVKVAEVMSLRRAFDVSAPAADERWDTEVPVVEPEPPKSLAEKVAEKAAAVAPATAPEPSDEPTDGASPLEQAMDAMPKDAGGQTATPEKANAELPKPKPAPVGMVQCESLSPFAEDDQPEQCKREAGHAGLHKTHNSSWPA